MSLKFTENVQEIQDLMWEKESCNFPFYLTEEEEKNLLLEFKNNWNKTLESHFGGAGKIGLQNLFLMLVCK